MSICAIERPIVHEHNTILKVRGCVVEILVHLKPALTEDVWSL